MPCDHSSLFSVYFSVSDGTKSSACVLVSLLVCILWPLSVYCCALGVSGSTGLYPESFRNVGLGAE